MKHMHGSRCPCPIESITLDEVFRLDDLLEAR